MLFIRNNHDYPVLHPMRNLKRSLLIILSNCRAKHLSQTWKPAEFSVFFKGVMKISITLQPSKHSWTKLQKAKKKSYSKWEKPVTVQFWDIHLSESSSTQQNWTWGFLCRCHDAPILSKPCCPSVLTTLKDPWASDREKNFMKTKHADPVLQASPCTVSSSSETGTPSDQRAFLLLRVRKEGA